MEYSFFDVSVSLTDAGHGIKLPYVEYIDATGVLDIIRIWFDIVSCLVYRTYARYYRVVVQTH